MSDTQTVAMATLYGRIIPWKQVRHKRNCRALTVGPDRRRSLPIKVFATSVAISASGGGYERSRIRAARTALQSGHVPVGQGSAGTKP